MQTRQEALVASEAIIDEVLQETFPASDPVSAAVGVGQPARSFEPEKRQEEKAKKKAALGIPDHKTVTLDACAQWDPRYGVFWIRVNDSAEFAFVLILVTAPLPLAHLSRDLAGRKSPLGESPHNRLQYEVNQAIARGAHQVASGIILMTHCEAQSL
jgi:hypothetical protein